MLDTLQVIFWSITYILIIIAGFQSRDIRKVSMPYVAGVLNFAWEICALYHSKGLWGHILWLGLDLVIVYFGFRFLSSIKQKMVYVAAIVISALSLLCVFCHPSGMLISVFVIDIIMAVVFLLERRKLSPKLQVSIGITKLIGDMFAGLHYATQSVFIGVIACAVFVCNVYYLFFCIQDSGLLEKYLQKKKCG